MSKKKKGDILEWMVYILEQSLATAPYTIQRNIKIPDQHGVLRELDIYVEVSVNGKELKYAFECRNYKSGIKLSHLTDFNDKIANKGIKGYFVTTSNYQSGTVEKAKALNIDLLRLHKREIIQDDIKQMLMIWKQYKIISIDAMGTTPGGMNDHPRNIIKNCPNCSKAVISIVEENAVPFLSQHIDQAVEQLHPEYADLKKLASVIGEQKATEFDCWLHNPGASITHAGIKIEFDWIKLGIKTWSEVSAQQPVNRNSFAYLDGAGADMLKNFSLNEFFFKEQGLVVGLTTLLDGRKKMAITDSLKKETIVHDIVSLGHIDELGLREILEQKENESFPNNGH